MNFNKNKIKTKKTKSKVEQVTSSNGNVELKTNKAAKKRYKYTATGKVKRTKSNRRHLLANKTPRAKARGKVQDAYADKTCEAGIKRLLPYGN